MASSNTSLTLLERLKIREADGWVRFCRVYGPLVYGWARHTGLQGDDAADVSQDVFLVVAGRIAEFRRLSDRNFRNWLWTISHHVIRAYYRKLRNRPTAVGGTSANIRFSQLATQDAVADEYSLDERSGIILRTLQLLQAEISESAWQAFWRTTVGGESASVVAADLGMTNWAVYKSKARLLHRIRLELNGLVSWGDLDRLDESVGVPRTPK